MKDRYPSSKIFASNLTTQFKNVVIYLYSLVVSIYLSFNITLQVLKSLFFSGIGIFRLKKFFLMCKKIFLRHSRYLAENEISMNPYYILLPLLYNDVFHLVPELGIYTDTIHHPLP